jgi:hypothetical protein
MNRTKSTYFKAALASALLLMASAGAWSQTSPVVYYQGFLKNDRGEPVSGSFSLKFSLHDAASGGTELWTETLTAPVENGLLTAALGTQ